MIHVIRHNFQAAYDSGRLFFQNWAKHVQPGGIGYKSDIDPINDLTNKTIDNAVIMHAVKVSSPLHIPQSDPATGRLARSTLI